MIIKEKIYFPGLNGMRAIAALLVIFSHIGIQLHAIGFQGYQSIDMAGYGVTMFFVLSGYLITYLLLTEYEKNKKISYKKFYVRRMLRIWPIYYLSLAITQAWMVFSGQNTDGNSLIFYLFMMANVPFVFGGMLGLVGQLWSVGVEEQFYLFWPWLFKKRNHLLMIMSSIIVVYILLRLFLRIYENGPFYTFLGITRFHCMAMGGIGALAVFENWKIVKNIHIPLLQMICWLILIISLYRPLHIFSIIDGEIYAVIFLILIINVSTNSKTIIRLENPLMNWLGKLSYGMYVYHTFSITIVFNSLKSHIALNITGLLIIFLSVIFLTLIFSQLSYLYIEEYFLKIKRRFSVIISGRAFHEERPALLQSFINPINIKDK